MFVITIRIDYEVHILLCVLHNNMYYTILIKMSDVHITLPSLA